MTSSGIPATWAHQNPRLSGGGPRTNLICQLHQQCQLLEHSVSLLRPSLEMTHPLSTIFLAIIIPAIVKAQGQVILGSDGLPIVSLHMTMHFESGECHALGCSQDLQGRVPAGYTLRVSAALSRVERINADHIEECVKQGGVITPAAGKYICSTNIPLENTTNWDPSEFGIYRDYSIGVAPKFLIPPMLVNPNTHPNFVPGTNTLRTIAAEIDCRVVGFAGHLRWAYTSKAGGPCHQDEEFEILICASPGNRRDNYHFADSNGNTLADMAVAKDVFCPVSFPE